MAAIGYELAPNLEPPSGRVARLEVATQRVSPNGACLEASHKGWGSPQKMVAIINRSQSWVSLMLITCLVVVLPSFMMTTFIVSKESLAKDTQTSKHTHTQGHGLVYISFF